MDCSRLAWCACVLLSSLTLVFLPLAHCQSTDEAHVLPGQHLLEPQPSHDPAPGHMKPMRVDVDLVLVPVTVVDSKERPVLGLEKQNFTVYEGNQPQQIQFFSAEDSPISVGLILDLSKSMSNKLVTERAAVEAFFNNANAKDDYFVIAFSDRPRVLATSTQSIDDIQQKLAAANPDGHTALLDAVYLAVAKMRSSRYQRRALFIISDGGDNHSRYGLTEIKSLVQEAGVDVYAIGIFNSLVPFRSFEEFMGKRWLGEITDKTGGRTVAVSDLEEIPAQAAMLSREMRNQYLLGYRPLKIIRDGRWRKIKVRVTPPSGKEALQARYKKGYSATR